MGNLPLSLLSIYNVLSNLLGGTYALTSLLVKASLCNSMSLLPQRLLSATIHIYVCLWHEEGEDLDMGDRMEWGGMLPAVTCLYSMKKVKYAYHCIVHICCEKGRRELCIPILFGMPSVENTCLAACRCNLPYSPSSMGKKTFNTTCAQLHVYAGNITSSAIPSLLKRETYSNLSIPCLFIPDCDIVCYMLTCPPIYIGRRRSRT